jgi:hypothetical protein
MSYFRKVVAGLVKDDITDFVGEVGNIFFNIDTGELRLSDGVTPGGLPIYNQGGGGATIVIIGSVPNSGALPSPYTGDIGDTYITVDTGDFYLWDGNNWINTGPIAGPIGYTGSHGNVGYTGSAAIGGVPAGGTSGQVLTKNSNSNYDTIWTTIIGGAGNGYTGSVGFTGSASNVIGFTGSAGLDGAAVDRGYTGSVGYSGSQGSVGYSGSHGSVGYSGSKGETGSQGVSINFLGAVNTVGDLPASGNTQGDAHIVYANGDLYVWNGTSWTNVGEIMGYTGSKGDTGYTGSVGYVGSASTVIGYTGSGGNGYTGSVGADGLFAGRGYTGSRGLDGYSGSVGYSGSRGIEGYTGSFGQQGYWGSNGGVGYTGSRGTGYTGSVGSLGYSGSLGYWGSVGYVGSAGTGTIGYSGSRGPEGPPGPSGATLYSFVITYSGANISTVATTATTSSWTITTNNVGTITVTHNLGKWPIVFSCAGTTSTPGQLNLRIGPAAGVAGGFTSIFDNLGNGFVMNGMTTSGTGTVSSGTCTVYIQFSS